MTFQAIGSGTSQIALANIQLCDLNLNLIIVADTPDQLSASVTVTPEPLPSLLMIGGLRLYAQPSSGGVRGPGSQRPQLRPNIGTKSWSQRFTRIPDAAEIIRSGNGDTLSRTSSRTSQCSPKRHFTPPP